MGAWRTGKHGEPAQAHPIDFDALALSDVISFHAYCSVARMRFVTESLEGLGRPVFCTEWMARGIGSRIAEQLPHFRSRKVSAFQWGLVKGRTQTHLPWPGVELDPARADGVGEWFHDLPAEDGAAYSPAEIEAIHSLLLDGAAA